jgi:ParB family transcriptional regulator, chromosome partitioning protein
MKKIESGFGSGVGSSNIFPGLSDEVSTSRISFSLNPLRSQRVEDDDDDDAAADDLIYSIMTQGLLQPILVRVDQYNKNYEVVAGNRRLAACKILKWKKIPCQIVEMDDREAFEASITENVHRKSLTPLEEARVFKSYITEHGWGSASKLARRIGKSTSYVSKRMKLLELPEDVQTSLENNSLNISAAEELIFSKNEEQSKLAELVKQRCLTSKNLRNKIKELNRVDEPLLSTPVSIGITTYYSRSQNVEKAYKCLERAITAIKIAMIRLVSIIEDNNENWILYETLMQHKHKLHQEIEILIKEKSKIGLCRNHPQ